MDVRRVRTLRRDPWKRAVSELKEIPAMSHESHVTCSWTTGTWLISGEIRSNFEQ